MGTLVLLRHGQSQWNKENRFTGFKDIDLTEKGEVEARAAGEKLAELNLRLDHVFTSTLMRAYRTAALALEVAHQADVPQTRHDDLRERNYGDLAGLDKDETRTKYGEEQVHIWRRSYDVRPPGGESLQDVVARVAPYYHAHIEPLLKDGKNILIAAHGNTLRALLIVLGLKTPENIEHVEIVTGDQIVIDVSPDGIVQKS